MSSLTGQHKCHIHGMENVTLTSKERTRLQVLNSLLAEHMTLDQAAMLMGVTTRHTRRMLATYREEGAAAVAHGHRAASHPTQRPMPCWPMWSYRSNWRYNLSVKLAPWVRRQPDGMTGDLWTP